MTKLKELKAAREAALGAYNAAKDIKAAAHDNYHANSDCWEAYSAARDNYCSTWAVYVAAYNAYEAEDK